MNQAAEFSVAARSLDWTSDSVRVYGTAAHGALTVSSGTDIGFPSIPELKTGQTLNGAGGLLNRIAAVFTGGNAVSSLRLDDTSIDARAEYLGLFQKNSGTIRGLRLLSPQVDVSSPTLKGVGAVCGYSRGSLEDDSVDGADARVRAALTAADAEGIGGVAGVIEGNGRTTGLSASGAVTGTLPVSGEARGIGGIAGSLTVSGTAVKNLTSRASVTGNRSAGGIAGYLAGSGQPTRQDLRDCTNEGLVLSSADADKTSLAGRYIGGIVGYAYHASLGGCTSRAGRAADYEYTQADRSLLRGRYVGGIVGYSNGSVLYRCSTGADGYVLGSEYVGGIVGGANEGANRLLLSDGTARVTANASCVIGNSYVGGIIGRNSGGSVIENCVNTGVAAGYQAYIGGICGANEKNASIVNCASYVSDTDGAVYRRVTGWGATGSYAGGLTGYNGGSIVFDKKSAVSTRSVAGIVVGRDYVGGLVGYNDADGTIDVDYTLIGGSVFASGDCAGGLAGLNASISLLGQTLTVKPASVQGRYYVGGAIGANVVDPDTDITVGSLRVDNSLGSVTAEAFCGGLIGYQRTYTEKDRAGRALYALLPGIAENGDNVPGAVTASTNPHTVTITADANRADRLTLASNNMTIRAYAYAGGIVGCGEPQSRMQVVGCLNAGGFDRPADGVFPDSRLKTGVNLAAYLRTQGHEDAAQALSDEPGADTLRVSIVGGIVGVNGENHVIDRCASRGTMNGLDAMGGVVGLNEGLIKDCTLSGSMGSATQDYIGGIAGLNVGGRTAGTLENCTAGKNCTVTGRTAVGGIAGFNLSGGRVQNCTGSANVSGAGRVGGIAGENGGEIVLSGAKAGARRVTGSGSGVGGVIGVNTADGTLRAADDSAQGDVIAADSELTVRGGSKVGGIAGINRGTLGGVSGSCLTSQAAEVRAESGLAGGIAGAQEGAAARLCFAKNLGRVTANTGAAGGIVGISSGESTVENCYGDGSVASSDGYAGGIAGENLGRIQNCAVGSGGAAVTLTTRSRTAAGAVCAVNHKGGTVSGAEIGDRVTISGSAFLLGALVGDNSGTVADAEVAQQPEYDVSASALQVGGAVGINRPGGTVRSVRVTSDFKGFSRYQYLGGVVGQNCAPSSDGTAAGKVENCTYSGAITEGKSAAANCYGGIAGVNGGLLSGNTVSALTLTADGVYTATATSSASDKERLSTHIGGIAGKNDTSGIIEQCYIDNTRTGSITVKNGMVGGVTGYNKGTVALSGDKSTETLMANVREVSELLANAKGLSADSSWVKWNDGADIEELTYASSGKPVAQGRTMQIIVTGNGSLGGIAGCNAPSGALERCVSGNWLLVNRSDSISVGTGGIIGMNESEKDLSFLLNRAFVGRQLRSANTNRFAGGIIGTQTNRTTADWLIEGCINYGTVYGCLSHYSGGIIGQWTNNGGTLERCYNYGNLQTTFKANWVGASGGIVAQLYHASSGQDFNILSCQNHGSLYGRNGRSVADCANDSGGILGNVTAYAADAGKGQAFTINVADCVNGPGVEIYSGSMASGIVGFFSADGVANITVNSRAQQLITNATENITLNIDRCRNYAQTLSGYNFTAGIFGDRYAYGRTQPATDTYIQNCFSVTPGQKDREIVFMHSGGSDTLDAKKTGNNYYFDDAWGITNQYTSGGIASGYARSESRRAYSRMLGYGLFDHRLFAAVAGPTLTPVDSFATTAHGMYCNMTPSNTSIDGHGIMTETSSGKIVGRVIYDMPYSYEPYVFNHGGSTLQQAIKTRNGGASGMDAYARTAYRDFEHGRTDGALDGSFGVSLRQNSEGGFEVSITDDDRPLYYEGRVSVDGREVLSGLRFVPNQKGQGLWDPELNGTQAYGAGTTEGTFQLPAGLDTDTAGQSITLSVRAVSLFEDTAPSAWKQAQTVDVSVLPTPDISIRLTGHENASRSNGWKDSAVYRLSLNNLADYAPFGGWKVVCRLGSQTVTLDKSHPAAEIRGGGLQELIVTASADVTNGIQPASVTRTIPIDTPAYRPDGSISSLTASYSGSTAADFTVTAALTVRETTMETPPVYRIELLGTVGGQEYVFAHEDVLTSAGSTVTANFRDLPVQYFADTVKNRRVRAWYAASGLGDLELEAGAGETVFPEDADEVAAALAVDEVERREIDLDVGDARAERRVFAQKTADAPQLELGDLGDEVVLFREADEDVRGDPAKLGMPQAAERLEGHVALAVERVDRLIVDLEQILLDRAVQELLDLLVVVEAVHGLAVVLDDLRLAALGDEGLEIFRVVEHETARAQLFRVHHAAQDDRRGGGLRVVRLRMEQLAQPRQAGLVLAQRERQQQEAPARDAEHVPARDLLHLFRRAAKEFVAAPHARDLVHVVELVGVDRDDVKGLVRVGQLVHPAQQVLLVVQAGQAVHARAGVVDGQIHGEDAERETEAGRQHRRIDGLRGDAEGGERKDREERREIAAADRRAVHRDKDRRPRDVQQGADVQQQIPRAVAVAGAVEIEQHLGEGVGQDDTEQSDGRDAHAQHDRGRDHAARAQRTDVVQQQQRQERLKQVEHRVREHPADIEAVRGVQDEARADQLRGNVQTDDAQQTAEHPAVPVVHLPLAGILPYDDQQHRHSGDQIMYVGCHSASPPSLASFFFKCASASAFHALMLRDFPSSSHRRLKPKVMVMRARGAQVRL